jgi:hypothetical protein
MAIDKLTEKLNVEAIVADWVSKNLEAEVNKVISKRMAAQLEGEVNRLIDKRIAEGNLAVLEEFKKTGAAPTMVCPLHYARPVKGE